MPPPPASKPPVSPVGLMVIGTEMAGFTVAGVLLDLVVFGTMPWFTVGFTLLGLAAAFMHLVKMVKPKPPPPGAGS
ncbi:AtpZ/AtpI family protein [bacterium]|nr:AtpZ/AtpI family protein [bacterium]